MVRGGLLATVVLYTIAAVAGGAVVRLIGLLRDPTTAITLLFLTAVVVGALSIGLNSRPTGSTAYWR